MKDKIFLTNLQSADNQVVMCSCSDADYQAVTSFVFVFVCKFQKKVA
jgi:hypothetical protein